MHNCGYTIRGDCVQEIKITENIRVLRRRQGYKSARALAEALAEQGYYCSVSLVKNWESGYRQPTIEGVAALCDVFGVTADDLLFGDASEKNKSLPIARNGEA